MDLISELSSNDIAIIQSNLGIASDGIIGPITKAAYLDFQIQGLKARPLMISEWWWDQLEQDDDFSTVDATKKAIIDECLRQGIGTKAQTAYVLATTSWETNHTFKPVKEAYWLSEGWRKRNLRYYPFYGRGFVQLTWIDNYVKFGEILDIDLVNNPDLALEPGTACFIMVNGFKTGAFTGRKITDYINSQKTDFLGCRRCINGMDKAAEIAHLADGFMREL